MGSAHDDGLHYAQLKREKRRERIVDGYNIMRDALSWFTSHDVEKKLGHLPQWVVMAREVRDRKE